MDNAVVETLDVSELCIVVVAITAFVTHTPEDYTGVIAIAKYHTTCTVEVNRTP